MQFRVLVIALMLVFGPAVGRAQDAGAEIRSVISGQISAFEADDLRGPSTSPRR